MSRGRDFCGRCGSRLFSPIVAVCPACGHHRTHQECYPDQYAHNLVGRQVRFGSVVAVVERVTGSRFGQMAFVRGYDCPFLLHQLEVIS